MNIQTAYDNWSATYDADANLTRDLDEVVTRETVLTFHGKSSTNQNTLLFPQAYSQ